MTIDDLPKFSDLLGEVFDLLAPERGAPDDKRTAAWFRVLAPFPFDAVSDGFTAHLRRPATGRTLPIPSDIVAQIEAASAAADGRPGADEAWAIASKAVSEHETVVWTEETAFAWGQASGVMALGDEVGARVGFREVYNRLVAEARAAGRPVNWQVCEGFDPARRARAVAEAVALGRLPSAGDYEALPAPRGAVLLLEAPEEGAGGRSQRATCVARRA